MSSMEEEAQKLMKSAKKNHTKSITKWSVSTSDWDSAASEYEKAAKIYAHLESTKQCREAFHLASMAHEKAANLYFAGKTLEALADVVTPYDMVLLQRYGCGFPCGATEERILQLYGSGGS